MPFTPYTADRYLDFDEVESFCRTLADAHPEWVQLDAPGESTKGRPLLVLTLSSADTGPDGSKRGERPALWLDAGTHASEWTGVSAVLYAVSQWMERLTGGDETLRQWFSTHEVVVMPCISPDGMQAMHDGSPYIRSSLRPPRNEEVRAGLDPCDIDGDGTIRMMRFKHPAGTFVRDDEWAPFLRPRTLDDDPQDAYFVCREGEFINWDGVKWTSAPYEYGIDLNRNFPAEWEPFSMYGMYGGRYPLSEPESRTVVDTFASHPHIGCALTMHTYTGCILTQPYRQDTPLNKGDIELMEQLAEGLADDTGYRVLRTFPDFMYDEDRPIPGVWADTISTVFGVPGYTVELWDPIDYAGLDVDDPMEFLLRPPTDKLKKFVQKFSDTPDQFQPWRSFDHPQLGEVEIGGIEYLRTVRNPPEDRLAEECETVFAMTDRARRSLPRVEADVDVTALGDGAHRVRLVLENLGFLPTSGLNRGDDIGASPPVSATIYPDKQLTVEQPVEQRLDHLDGWGTIRVQSARNAVYASLPRRGHRQYVEWTVQGSGAVRIDWHGGRGGRGTVTVEL